MTVLLVILAVLIAVAAVLSFVLLSPLWVRISYRQELCVVAGLSFIKFRILPAQKKKNKKNGRKKTKKKSNVTKESTPSSEKAKAPEISKNHKGKEKKDMPAILRLVLEIIKSLFDVMGKRAKITVDELYVTVSKPDAADTAVAFGICTGIVSNILAFTSNFGKSHINGEKVAVVPDFVLGKGSLEADITISVAAGSLLLSLVKGCFRGISRK